MHCLDTMLKAAAGQFLARMVSPPLEGEHRVPPNRGASAALPQQEQGDRTSLGGSAADVEVELDGQVSFAECLPGMGEGFGFYAAVQGVQVG